MDQKTHEVMNDAVFMSVKVLSFYCSKFTLDLTLDINYDLQISGWC